MPVESPPGATQAGARLQAVRDVAREGEPDRYGAALLAPADIAADLVTLAAFAAELGRVASQVREPMLGAIRLQWWRDAIAAASRGASTGHPVADALADLIRRRGLPTPPLDAMVEARLIDVGHELFEDDGVLLAYLDATEGRCFELALRLAGVAAGPGLDAAAQAAGRAYGLARSLGRLPRLLRHGAFPIAVARLAGPRVAPEALTARPVTPELAAAVATAGDALRSLGRRELERARGEAANLGAEAQAVLLPLAMVEPYFLAQERLRSQALERLAEVTPLGRLWRLWRAHRRRRF